MPSGLEQVLATLLHPSSAADAEHAWERFVAMHSGLILHAIRRSGGTHDETMDRYAFVLEQLRAQECRRLRAWVDDGRSRFGTWLVVVVRRLCHDHHRERYGRFREAGQAAAESRNHRRKLADLVTEELNPEQLAPDGNQAGAGDAALTVRRNELAVKLAQVVDRLDTSDRMLLTLRFRDDLSAPAIARTLGLPTPFHVYRRLNQLLARLRGDLESSGVDDASP